MSKEYTYIDIHAHVNFPDFDADREKVIERAQKAGVAMINVGTDVETSKSAVALAQSHEWMWATIGVHPMESSKGNVQSAKADFFIILEQLARDPKVVAIGECGLDYFHSKVEDIPEQKELFEKHIILAEKVGKPLMLHVRNGKFREQNFEKSVGVNAYQDVLDILKKYPSVRANFHFFAGSIQDLNNIIERGYSVSCTGVISFTSDYDDIIRSVPIDRIMSETDCPFVAPLPYRGKRNEPAYVTEVVKHIARICGEDEGIIAKQLVANAKRFFRIP